MPLPSFSGCSSYNVRQQPDRRLRRVPSALPGLRSRHASRPGRHRASSHELNDTAAAPAGTLRYCVERLSGPRFVIFVISGTINLTQGPLYSSKSYHHGCRPDSTVTGNRHPRTRAHYRHTRRRHAARTEFRVGNLRGEPSGVWIRNDANNVVIDHVSVSWSIWTAVIVGAGNAGHPPGEITIMDSLIAESIGCTRVNGAVPCDPATYPARGFTNSRAIGIGDAWQNSTPKVTLLRNVSANNNDRHPEIGGSAHTILVNNLIYNPSQHRSRPYSIRTATRLVRCSQWRRETF